MPNLAQMFSLANSKSSYSRPEPEIYAALDEGGLLVFNAVLKETSGFFLKFDTSTVTFVPGQTEYALPPDVSQLVHVGERLSAAEPFFPVNPEGIGSALENAQDRVGWDYNSYGYGSQFSFAGPYLTADAATGVQTQKIRISPVPTDTRMVELAYIAKWLPITDGSSLIMLPAEGTPAMGAYATAELLRSNDDSLAREYEAKGDKHLNSFLTWVRARQLQQVPQITPYLG